MKIIGTEQEVKSIMKAIDSGISCGYCCYREECSHDKNHPTCIGFLMEKIETEVIK